MIRPQVTGKRPIGEMLVEAGVITGQDLKVALEAQRQTPALLGVLLVQLGLAAEADILPILAQQLNRIDVTLHPKPAEVAPVDVAEALEGLLIQAVEQSATDVHFEPIYAGVKIRFRIDGILLEVGAAAILNARYPAVVSRIKILCNLDIAEKRMPQEGRTTLRIQGRDVDIRVSILPSRHGESIVIRMLQTEVPLSLFSIGLEEKTLEILQRILERKSGLVLVTGPTGCGKTTTLYACLDRLNDATRKIVTIEDPVEYTLPGTVQMQTNPQIDLTFGRLLRTVLRHDPNILMVGEIRDTETAEVAIRMALTGHLVFSTLHTNDAASTITRLLDMGIEPYLVASSLSCAIAQRLVRTLCPKCKGKRCITCMGQGLKGRTGIFECLVMHDEIRKLILSRATAEEIREKARTLGMRTLHEEAESKVQAGLTTREEVMRVIHRDELI